MGLVGMGDCNSTGTTGCKPKACVPPPTIDVITVLSDEERTCRRLRLKRSGHETVWVSDVETAVPLDEWSFNVAYAPFFEVEVDGDDGGCLVMTDPRTATPIRAFHVSIFNGDYVESSANFISTEVVGIRVFQQVAEMCGFTFADSEYHFNSIHPDGTLEEFCAVASHQIEGASFADRWLYVLYAKNIVRLGYDDCGGSGTTITHDLSSKFTHDVLWCLFDEPRGCFYVAGLDEDPEDEENIRFKILRVPRLGDESDATTVCTVDNVGSSPIFGAFTLFPDDLWWILDGIVYHYDLADEEEPDEPEVYLTHDSGEWPVSMRIGGAFIVGTSESCTVGCVCGETPTPTMELERVFPEEEIAGGADVCGDVFDPEEEEVLGHTCHFYYDYEITLCEGRTLQELIFQGTRSEVFINDVAVSSITDWSAVPLTGQLRFVFGSSEECDAKDGRWRVTVVDSNGCCTRYAFDVDCCLCCPPAGSPPTIGSVVGPVPAESDIDPNQPDASAWSWGIAECIDGVLVGAEFPGDGIAHFLEYMELSVGAPTVTECPGVSNEGYYVMNWGTAEPFPGDGPLPPCMFPSDSPRKFKHDRGLLGSSLCISATPVDLLGCIGEPDYYWVKGGGATLSNESPCLETLFCPEAV